jgi:serine protease Do
MQRHVALTLICLAIPLAAVLPGDRIVLTNGSVIEAVEYAETELTLEIDLGFETLSIPRTSIDRIERSSENRLYSDFQGGAERSLDDNIAAVGEAVVLVRTPVGLGSGFMIHSEGYLITNDHVIEGSTELTVVVYRQATDGLRKDEYKHIRIVASSDMLDLALLKIEPEEPEDFVTVPLGDSGALTQGQGVFAVGNPMGLERSLSEGIVALKSRLLGGQTYVQTTAALSPGNSGGPLFSLAGEVIGVNSRKVMAQGAEGLSFSIPVNHLKIFIEDQEAYAFDTLNANSGHQYYSPPSKNEDSETSP